ncbi:MAG: endolytic transglycosylase MltG [Anaerolineae bacterium]|nr:endolytic transglycosylase MltG [Anaerolineae bacterium]
MSAGRFLRLLGAILIPVALGGLFLCLILAALAVVLTPPGLNPIEAVGLRGYLLLNDEALNSSAGSDPTLRRFVVEADDTAQSVGVRLVTQGFIENGSLFARYTRYEGLDDDLRPGTFFISEAMTLPEIAATLTDPRPTTVRLTVIEGWRMEQIAEAIDAQPRLNFTGRDFLAVVGVGASIPADFQLEYGLPGGASLEGFLFPATYEINVNASALDFRAQLLAAFEANVADSLVDQALASNRTFYQVVAVASIVEREAVVADERPQIASVYLNRLNIGQKLDADPTTQYAIGNTRDGNWWPRITQADYQLNSPYNTYVIPALPPGPIANPSLSSIEAVVNPAETPYFYFRAACDGSGQHQFSITYEEHLARGC